MTNIHVKRALAVSVVAAALLGASATSAIAAAAPTGSDIPVYTYDAGSEVKFSQSDKHDFTYDVIGSSSATDVAGLFQCASDAETLQTFIAPIGGARDRTKWIAWAPSQFMPDTDHKILQFPMTLSGNTSGAPMSVQATGGDFEAGLACLKYNDVAFATAGVWYSTIKVTPVTGEWYALDGGTTTPPTTDPTLTAEIPVTATTISAAEGTLSLSVPANTTATLGAATLVNGLSTSTGTLGAITVNDGRNSGKQGWTLTTAVAPFVSSADATVSIPAAQLGIAPKVVSTTALGVTAAAASTAASAATSAPFAEASAATAVGSTVLNADLTFVAPSDKAAGTYTSKVTLTLASK
jgi:hypothetical protein